MYNWSCFHPTKFILMKIHKYTNILKVISLNYNPYNSCNHCCVHFQHVCLHLFKLTIHKLGGIIFVMNFMLNHWQFFIDVAPLHIVRTQCVCQWLKHILPLLSPLTLLHIVPFCEGPNQKSEGFAKEKKKREGFAKEKKPATFAMPSASQLVAQQSSQIYNEPLIIATLLRNSRQTKLCDPLNACPS